jgi:hypothetical protein
MVGLSRNRIPMPLTVRSSAVGLRRIRPLGAPIVGCGGALHPKRHVEARHCDRRRRRADSCNGRRPTARTMSANTIPLRRHSDEGHAPPSAGAPVIDLELRRGRAFPKYPRGNTRRSRPPTTPHFYRLLVRAGGTPHGLESIPPQIHSQRKANVRRRYVRRLSDQHMTIL